MSWSASDKVAAQRKVFSKNCSVALFTGTRPKIVFKSLISNSILHFSLYLNFYPGANIAFFRLYAVIHPPKELHESRTRGPKVRYIP